MTTIAQQMMSELKAEAAMTRKLLAKIPKGKAEFSPGTGVKTIGWNASHLAEIVGWVPMILNEPGLDIEAYEGTPPVKGDDVGELLKRFDENLAKSLAALEGVGDAKMDETWTMRMGAQVLFSMKKGECVRKWVFTHTAHHRGILSVSLRLAGVEHGSIYEE